MSHPLDHTARAIFLAALHEHREGELLECLFDGGTATVDNEGHLVLLAGTTIQQMLNQDDNDGPDAPPRDQTHDRTGDSMSHPLDDTATAIFHAATQEHREGEPVGGPMKINDTSKLNDAGHLLGALLGGTTGYITGMEAAGQQELVASTQLPSEIIGSTIADFTALGFTLNGPDPDDPLFQQATLPPGWVKRCSDHDMWSYIDDENGNERVAVFYKAAFYDRRAFMRLSRATNDPAAA